MSAFNAVDLIISKRDGGTLGGDAIRFLVDGYTRGDIPDYQVSALLMAIFLRGLDPGETLALTDAMLHSGRILDLSDVPGIKVDKHSTGGVGDKVSLILAPIVASCGVPVPMMSGRGLGHTGGTLDKLESIPGFRTALRESEVVDQLRAIRVAMMGQSVEVAPADRLLYALRDVTGTVESIPLIASSIMSKKLAEGIDALVLDVKVGRGAFMKKIPAARALAETLIGLAERAGKRAVAWLTRMEEPLGRAIGNWPEIEESVACLRGESVPDLMEVTLALAGEMLALGGAAESPDAGAARAREAVANGAAYEQFVRMVEAQGGSTAEIENPSRRTRSAHESVVLAPAHASGFISEVDAHAIGRAAVLLGAGRAKKEEEVDPLAGIVLETGSGNPVSPNTPLARLYTSIDRDTTAAQTLVQSAFRFAETPPPPHSLLLQRLPS